MVDVIAVESFVVKGYIEGNTSHPRMSDYLIDKFETGTIISGFGFLKIRLHTQHGIIVHVPEEYLGDKILPFANYHTMYKNDPEMLSKLPPLEEEFLSQEEMTIG